MTFVGDPKRGSRWLKSAVSEVQSGRSGWLAGVSYAAWEADDIPLRLIVGQSDRLLIVGQAPPRDGDELPPFHGRTGSALCKLMGCVDQHQLLERYDAINAWPWYEGACSEGDRFAVADTRDLLTLVELRASQVVLLGAARRAFGVRKTMPWFEGFRDPDRPGTVFYCAPHPSGRNHWWNSSSNRRRAEGFFEEIRK